MMRRNVLVILLVISCLLVLMRFADVFANGEYSFGPPELPLDVPKPIALYVQTEPALPIGEVLRSSKGEIYDAKVGTTVQLRVEAEYEDGSRRDVTQTPYTFYHSIDSGSTVLRQTGEVSFRRPEKLPHLSQKEKKLDTAHITVAYGRNLIGLISIAIIP